MTISKFTAGTLHENHKALIARGPIVFLGIEPARYESRPNGEGGTCEVPMVTGSCAICGQGICDVVRISVGGEPEIIGLDCAATLECNLGKSYRCAVTGLRKVKREATTRRKAEKLSVVLAPLRAEMTEWAAGDDRFAASVAANALRIMDSGRRPSPEHMALIGRIRSGEVAPRPRFERPVVVARPVEVNVAAPEGKVLVRGVIVSTKSTDGQYGPTYRMTVKVATSEGVYLVNGTIPQALFDACDKHLVNDGGWIEVLKGCEVEFSATLTRSDDRDFFAFANRPTKAKLVAWPAEKGRPTEDARSEEPDGFAQFEAA